MEDITTLNLITIFISLIALIVSCFNIYNTNANNKRQIRIGKLEELLEIQRYLESAYYSLYFTFMTIQDMEEMNHIGTITDAEYEYKEKVLITHKERLEILIQSKEKLFEKISRIDVPTRCYVKEEKLKIKILTYIRLVSDLSKLTFGGIEIEDYAFKVIPPVLQFKKFILKIESDIIKEMKLTNKNIGTAKLKAYRDKEFINEFD